MKVAGILEAILDFLPILLLGRINIHSSIATLKFSVTKSVLKVILIIMRDRTPIIRPSCRLAYVMMTLQGPDTASKIELAISIIVLASRGAQAKGIMCLVGDYN